MKQFVFCLCILIAGFMACQKDKKPDALAAGSLSGRIQPRGAATTVTATGIETNSNYTITPDSSGAFLITNMPPGYYTIKFAVAAGITPVDSINVKVTTNAITDMGTIVFTAVPIAPVTPGSLSGKVVPAQSITRIVAVSSNHTYQYTATPDGNGYFSIAGMAPGSYNVGFTMAAGYKTPDSVAIVINSGLITNIGLIAPQSLGSGNKIDTITNKYTTENDLITRAPYDSVIVIIGNLTIFSGAANTAAVKDALNKISVITGYINFEDFYVQSITMNKLTELGAFLTADHKSLSSVNMPSLKKITGGGIQIWDTPLLTTLNLGSLQELTGELSLIQVGFTNLDMFKTASFYPFKIELESNPKLSDISALHFGSDSAYNLTITSNSLLTNLDGLQGIRLVKNKISIDYNAVLQSLKGMENITTTSQFSLTNNPLLSELCPAKQAINSVKNLPSYTVRQQNPLGDYVTVTIYPFVASKDGSYAAQADVVAAVNQCP